MPAEAFFIVICILAGLLIGFMGPLEERLFGGAGLPQARKISVAPAEVMGDESDDQARHGQHAERQQQARGSRKCPV